MAFKTQARSIAGLNRALRALPKEASAELRDASQEIAQGVAATASRRALTEYGGIGKYVAPTIKARRDRVPVVKMGGKKKLPGRGKRPNPARQTVGDLIWGAEFGGQGFPSTMQFRPHRGQDGYALWPTIRDDFTDILDKWADALYDAAVDSARKGAGR